MIIHVKVSGRVQGVGFRSWIKKQADSLNLSGWVRNRIDGKVEMMAEGEQSKVLALLSLCQKGSFFSRVRSVEPVVVPDAFIPPIDRGVFVIQGTV